jgi:hypothetical protein
MAASGNLETGILIQQPVCFHQERSFKQQEINNIERQLTANSGRLASTKKTHT